MKNTADQNDTEVYQNDTPKGDQNDTTADQNDQGHKTNYFTNNSTIDKNSENPKNKNILDGDFDSMGFVGQTEYRNRVAFFNFCRIHNCVSQVIYQ